MKKIISLLLVAVFCFSFAGCTKKDSALTFNLADKPYPIPNGFDYGMSKADAFKVLGLSENSASEKTLNEQQGSHSTLDTYLYKDIIIEGKKSTIKLEFMNLTDENGDVKTGLSTITLFTEKDNEQTIIDMLNKSNFKLDKSVSQGTDENSNSVDWTKYSANDKTTVSEFCKKEGLDYNEFIKSCSYYIGVPEKMSKSALESTDFTCYLLILSIENSEQLSLTFSGGTLCMIRLLKK